MDNKLKKFRTIFLAILQIPLNTALFVIYLIIILPYFIVLKNQEKPAEKDSCWIDIPKAKDTLETLRRQF